ncbi:MAG TPA: DUF3105 domain-containing protein [Jatrophihabitans sp.]|jgi:hypothetical protein
MAQKPVKKSAPPNRVGSAGRPTKKPGKSIVNQRNTPWGIIITAIVLVVFAGVIIGVAVTRSGGGGSTNSAVDDAKKIPGIIIKNEPNRNHVTSPVTYDTTPPIGGNHSPYWGDCTGTVYANAIANENAVHMLEHGAVWITYNKDTIAAGDLDKLKALVQGRNGMALSPYPDLNSPISLQFWGHQLFVNSASDPSVERFINDLLLNPDATPEYGATCSDPDFVTNPSTFGNPQWSDPGAGSATMPAAS